MKPIEQIADSRPAAPTKTAVALSQDFLAQIFAERHAGFWRFIAKKNVWLEYDAQSGLWRVDEKCRTFDLARAICREHAPRAATASTRRHISSAPTVAGVLRLASTDPHHAATVDQWDRDPMLLNTPGGVIDLRTGNLIDYSPQFYMTKTASVAPREMETPVWDSFLEWAQPDPEVRDYLARRHGYALTGDVSAQTLEFDYGTGGNGKGLNSRVALEILGTYAVSSPVELLTENANDSHPTELARLYGARLVVLSETEAGKKWNESRIKMMTGGDKITARFMRQDFFEYVPEFKMFVQGNHMPSLRNVDEAIKRRLHVVHWAQTVDPDSRDDRLMDKLRPEFPGILHRWIQGALEYQRGGLQPPAAVLVHTREYLDGEDKLGLWLSECDASQKANVFATKEALFGAWSDWCLKQREFPGTKIKLSKSLKERGFQEVTQNNQRGFYGIKPVVSGA